MKALDRKLFRDLWRIKGQALAISFVIVSGVSAYIMFISVMDSLNLTREKFYRENRFAEAFSSLKRAPESLKDEIREIPGVETVETRVVAEVKLELKGFPEPVTARLVSLPDIGEPHLNKPYIRRGRLVDPWKDDEVVVSEAFADAHRFSPGDTLTAIINGRKKDLVIVGIALSPEFVLQSKPGAISPDFKRYAVLWMGRDALGNAYDMKGAFNDVSLTLTKGASLDDVLTRLDKLLDRYGGLGSYGRKDQISHRFLSEEFRELQRLAEIFPILFIGVAAFLLNVVMTRTISMQRDQLATLKAFGYGNWAIGVHYLKLVVIIVLVGAAGGVALGVWLGKSLGGIYMVFYRFPYLVYALKPSVAVKAAAITIAAAFAGTIHAVWKAAALPPAEAMRPEPPARYRKTIVEMIGVWKLLQQPTRIIIRNIERRPVRSLLTITGIAISCAIMIGGTFSRDSIEYMIDVQFKLTHREDITVTFVEPASYKALYDLRGLYGVEDAEVFRSVPVRLKSGHRSYRTFILGLEPVSTLYRPLDMKLRPLSIPPAGIALSDYLGGILGVKPGDMLTVEALEGKRQVVEVPVVALVNQLIGLTGYMDMGALNRLMGEGPAVSGAYLKVDPLYQKEIYGKLVDMPRVAGAAVRKDEIKNFYDTQAEVLLFYTFVASVLAATIAFGVVYSSARIALSERSRELASLRVLGYTRAEISYIFLGELGLLTIAAIPLGFVLGKALCSYMAVKLSSDLFRINAIIGPETYSLAAAVVVIAAALSGLIVRHRLDHLDLVEVLKARE